MKKPDKTPPGDSKASDQDPLSLEELEQAVGGQGDYDTPPSTPDPWEPNQN